MSKVSVRRAPTRGVTDGEGLKGGMPRVPIVRGLEGRFMPNEAVSS